MHFHKIFNFNNCFEAVTTDLNVETIERSYFFPDGQVLDIGFGREVWIGNFSSVRPVKMGWKNGNCLRCVERQFYSDLLLKIFLPQLERGRFQQARSEGAAPHGGKLLHQAVARDQEEPVCGHGEGVVSPSGRHLEEGHQGTEGPLRAP